MTTPQPEPPKWPPPGDTVALEPADLHHGLTAEQAAALIPKEIG
jgi:hypothetical protein